MRRFLFPAALLTTNTVFAAEQTAISPAAGLLQIFLGLIAVLALMAVAAWSFKKIGPVTTGNKVPVKIVGGVNVGNRERIMVVEVADQWIVVGITASQINTLSTMPKQINLAEQQDDAQPVNPFSTWLKRTMDKRNEPQQ
ncbi:flagellar biosynthetic protein FliO [Undibacterium sp.]|jgi:flagellar protein FliO/FliZ|uniref:flagellar biosynthetic protein FliO n=1 Tax=Undibacterium sp. TaxID=1914977 RepID=UPI002BBACADD|nr:flagellar biosynthetic protein FliO [Undibacterium sp.]HTD07168.1 flagellar biosynthetic protein FliO [Undibacterium sp.]